MKKTFYLFYIILIGISACSDRPDCLVVDSVVEIKLTPLNEDDYFLYPRTSGFDEKEHFYELFKGVQEFDDCGLTGLKPIFQVHVDNTEGFPVKLVVSNNDATLIYSSTEKSDFDLKSIEVEILEPLGF